MQPDSRLDDQAAGVSLSPSARLGSTIGCSGRGVPAKRSCRLRKSAARASSTVAMGTVMDSKMMMIHTCSTRPCPCAEK